MASTTLDPESAGYFQRARNRITDTYNLSTAQNTYQRSVAQGEYARNTGNVARQYAKLRDRLPGSYIKRGLINSGIYQRGLAEHASDETRSTGNLAQAYAEQLGGYDLAGQQLLFTRNAGYADIASQEADRLAALRQAGIANTLRTY